MQSSESADLLATPVKKKISRREKQAKGDALNYQVGSKWIGFGFC